MGERQEFQPKVLVNRELLTPMDLFRSAEFITVDIISGATASNARDVLSGGGIARMVSSPVRMRFLNIDIFNANAGWVQLEFRDGIWTGDRVYGPVTIPGLAERKVPQEELMGRYVTSAIFIAVLSGYAGQPLSSPGVQVNVSFVSEPRDIFI